MSGSNVGVNLLTLNQGDVGLVISYQNKVKVEGERKRHVCHYPYTRGRIT